MALDPTDNNPPAETPPPAQGAGSSEPPSPPPLTPEQLRAQEEAAAHARDLAAAYSLLAAVSGFSRLKPTRTKDASGMLEAMTVEHHSYPYKLEVSSDELAVVQEILSNGSAHVIENDPANAGAGIVKLSPSAYSRLRGHLPRFIRDLGGALPGDAKKGPSRG